MQGEFKCSKFNKDNKTKRTLNLKLLVLFHQSTETNFRNMKNYGGLLPWPHPNRPLFQSKLSRELPRGITAFLIW